MTTNGVGFAIGGSPITTGGSIIKMIGRQSATV
jgi:hypothetical protein